MRNPATLFLSACAVAVFGCWLAEFADIHADTLFENMSPAAIRADYEHEQRNAFVPSLWAALDALSDGRTSLRAASKQLLEDARRLHPTFLRHLDAVEQGASIDIKVANYLLGYFDGEVAVRASQVDARRRENLKAELAQILKSGL